jgi:hypothetical protein
MLESPFDPSPRTLRQFGAIWLVFFGAMGAWQWLHHGRATVGMILVAMAVTIGPLGIANPRLIRPIFIGWMTVVYPIGWTISRLVLGLLFYGLFTPVALVFRMIGRDELKLKPQPQAKTYWSAKPQVSDKTRYLRQF